MIVSAGSIANWRRRLSGQVPGSHIMLCDCRLGAAAFYATFSARATDDAAAMDAVHAHPGREGGALAGVAGWIAPWAAFPRTVQVVQVGGRVFYDPDAPEEAAA
ncbi:MAG: hypothetical protein ACU0BF_09970 [Paracoccaceae bacterium]